MNVFFITELKPFPPDRGERIRSYNLINSILEFSEELLLMAGNAPPREARYRKVQYLEFPGIYTKNRWVNLLFLFWRRRAFVRSLKKILSDHEIDLVFLDYNFLGQYIQIFRNRGIRVVYGTHNVQSYLNVQRPVSGLKERVFIRLKFMLEKLHEQRYFKRADSLIAVSGEDLDYYRKQLNHSNTFLIPNYIDEKDYTGYAPAKKQQVIMTGNFTAFQNYAGLQWFLQHVWDEELAGIAELVIVGHGSLEVFEKLRNQGLFTDRAEALGSVEDLKGNIAGAKAAIIPLQHGSGTRLKCIEAMALKTNIVSTSVGAEGIRHNGSILIADEPEAFKKELIRLLSDEVQNEEKAYRVFMEEYSFRANTRRLKAMLMEQ